MRRRPCSSLCRRSRGAYGSVGVVVAGADAAVAILSRSCSVLDYAIAWVQALSLRQWRRRLVSAFGLWLRIPRRRRRGCLLSVDLELSQRGIDACKRLLAPEQRDALKIPATRYVPAIATHRAPAGTPRRACTAASNSLRAPSTCSALNGSTAASASRAATSISAPAQQHLQSDRVYPQARRTGSPRAARSRRASGSSRARSRRRRAGPRGPCTLQPRAQLARCEARAVAGRSGGAACARRRSPGSSRPARAGTARRAGEREVLLVGGEARPSNAM